MAATSGTMNEQPTSQEPIQPFTVQSWTHNVIRPILIVLLIAALMGTVFSFAISVDPNRIWTLGYSICFLVILESYFTTIWLDQPQRRNLHHLKYRAAELLVLALSIRVLTWGVQGNWPQISQWLQYLRSPLTLVSDSYFWIMLLLCLFAWQRTIAITLAFVRMKPDEAEQAYYSLPRQERDSGTQPISLDRSFLFYSFTQQFIVGGLIVLFFAALASFDYSSFPTRESDIISGITRLNLAPGMLASLTFYFICGFLLLSQGRLAILEIRWLTNEAKLQTPVGRYWYRQTFFLLLVIGLIAAFLPIGSTLPFMRILNLILYAIITLISTLIYLISLLIYAILSFFIPESEASVEPPTPPPPPPPPEQTPIVPSDTLQFIFSSAFWAIAVIISIIAFSFFLKDRGITLNSSFLQRLWLTIKLWWYQMRQGLNDQIQEIQGGLQSLFQQDDNPESNQAPPWRFIRLNALSPREKVYYFYLSTLKRADQKGVSRQESETPTEFSQDLKINWPDAEKEIEELTDAFLQARYSPAPMGDNDISPIKQQWKRLKSSLRKRKKENKS